MVLPGKLPCKLARMARLRSIWEGPEPSMTPEWETFFRESELESELRGTG